LGWISNGSTGFVLAIQMDGCYSATHLSGDAV
jgi:hypothetical protein